MLFLSKHNFALPNSANGGIEFLMSNAEAAETETVIPQATKKSLVSSKKLLVNMA